MFVWKRPLALAAGLTCPVLTGCSQERAVEVVEVDLGVAAAEISSAGPPDYEANLASYRRVDGEN